MPYSIVLIAFPAAMVLAGIAAAETMPPQDSILAGVRRSLTVCDSAWRELSYVATTRERELNGDGGIDKETMYKSRVFVRRHDQREFLEAMWENGQPVSEKKLKKEIADHERQQRKQIRERAKNKKQKESGTSFGMMEPFREQNRADYDLTGIVPDTVGGIPVWKVAVQPLGQREDLLKGIAWVAADTYRAVAEAYQLAKLPGGVKSMDMRFDYDDISAGCALPTHFTMRARGRALLVIKFNVEVEMQIDSVRVNPGLPDSLFAIPEE